MKYRCKFTYILSCEIMGAHHRQQVESQVCPDLCFLIIRPLFISSFVGMKRQTTLFPLGGMLIYHRFILPQATDGYPFILLGGEKHHRHGEDFEPTF